MSAALCHPLIAHQVVPPIRLLERGVDVKGKTAITHIYHDRWCPLELGGGTMCLCNPDIAIEVDGVCYGEDGMPMPANECGEGASAT